jgi:hypothetical protein
MTPGIDRPGWNPRYIAYAKSNGLSPDDQLARDERDFPGGCMVAFVNWINSKWAEWHGVIGEAKSFHTCEDHKNFDEWLNNLGGGSGGILDKRQDRQ